LKLKKLYFKEISHHYQLQLMQNKETKNKQELVAELCKDADLQTQPLFAINSLIFQVIKCIKSSFGRANGAFILPE